jgi:hypothetical protein
MSLEDTLTSWARPPSETERDRADNAARIVREAIGTDAALSRLNIRVFSQGSYRANTNVRLDSDVDICVLCSDTFFYDLDFSDLDQTTAGIQPATLTYVDFRNMVEAALVRRFGRSGVTRGNKAFDVHANAYRLDADVVAAFEYRRYNKRGPLGQVTWHEGIAFLPDTGFRIVNWPEQTYNNGVQKNNATARRYKRAIRILKRLRNYMQEQNVAEANDIGSFLIESLVWNVPDACFNQSEYRDVVRSVLVHTFNNTLTDEACAEWGEVNELKYVLKNQPALRARVNRFLGGAWNVLGFK